MFQPTHYLTVPGSARSLVEAVRQDGTEPWFELYCETDDAPLFTWGADGKVRLPRSGSVVHGATVERISR